MAKSLPNQYGAEQAVLGTIFLDPKKIVSVSDRLRIEDFFDLKHQLIYEAMLKLNQENLSIDQQSVSAMLEKTNMIGKAGGTDYLFELSDLVPSTAHLETYEDLVKDSSLIRQIIEVSSKIVEMGYQGEHSANEYLSVAEEEIFKIAQKRKTSVFATLAEVMDEVKEKIEYNRTRGEGITGLSTGFSEMDKLTAGLQPQELIILAARPSMGKSAFAMNLALNVALKNKQGKAGVAVFSLEMSNDQLGARMLSAESNVHSHKIKSGRLEGTDWQFLESGRQTLSKLNIFFDDSAAVTIADIRAKCRKLSQEGKLDFVVIDYLQLIKTDEKIPSRQEEVARISRGLKQMARELNIPVLALSQLSREVEKREDKHPILADLRESGSIEQDADIVLFLYRGDYYKKDKTQLDNLVEIDVAKNRQGSSGNKLEFIFSTEFSRFRTKPKDE